jgi:hypothetical protein
MATRSDIAVPFGMSTKIVAIAGFVQAPSISPDEKSLYYHGQQNGHFVIYKVNRP